MKDKNYWDKGGRGSDPFSLPRRVSKGVSSSAKDFGDAEGGPGTVKYIWIHVTEEGRMQSQERDGGEPAPALQEWLNIVDESASLGAEWMVVYVGASLADCPAVFDLCAWAQATHGLKVGIHMSSANLSDGEIEHIEKLDTANTYLLADKEVLDSLRFLEDKGVQLLESHLTLDVRNSPCTGGETIACVGSDGGLYTCGLVLGDKEYAMGHSQDRKLHVIMKDGALPHAVQDTMSRPDGGCDACPPRMVRRLLESEKG